MGGINPEGQDRLPAYPQLEEPYALTALDREGEERGSHDTHRPIPFQQTKLGLTLSFDKAPSEANAIDYIVEVTLH